MYKYIKASRTVGFVGIWWYCTGKVIGRMVDVDNGYDDGRFIHYDNFKNHSTEWREVLNEQLPEQYDLLYPLQYKCIERGRVIYNIVTQSYEIACSQAASKDQKLIHAVVDAFHLSDCRYDVVAYNHYYITKPTGNSVIDDLEYGFH